MPEPRGTLPSDGDNASPVIADPRHAADRSEQSASVDAANTTPTSDSNDSARAARRRAFGNAPALLLVFTLAVLGVAWHLVPTLGLVNPRVMPTPAAVVRGLWVLSASGMLWQGLRITLVEVVIGFILGASGGLAVGGLLATFPLLRRTLTPYILGMQALPKIVLAPLLISWLGFGVQSKIAVAVTLCFFPVMVNTMVGLEFASPQALKLMRLLGASRWHVYTKLRLPTALPLIFVGLKHGLLLAFSGALVAEILIGSSEGLGGLVRIFNAQIQMDMAIAVVSVVVALAISLVSLFDRLDRRIIFWRDSDQVGGVR